MATGDPDDIVSRVRATIPPTWYPDDAVFLDGLLMAFGTAASWVYGLIGYTRLQTRIATATDGWLDLIANDFFGRRVTRGSRSDALFRKAIIAELFRPKQTRAAVIDAVQGLTGKAPLIFEPARPQDTGGYSPGPSGDGIGRVIAYNTAGGYGSLMMPYQFLVHAFRVPTGGIPSVGGYSTLSAYVEPSGGLPVILGGGWPGAYSTPAVGSSGLTSTIGGYSTPSALEYGSLDFVEGTVTDAAIYAAVNGVRAAGVTAWTAITN